MRSVPSFCRALMARLIFWLVSFTYRSLNQVFDPDHVVAGIHGIVIVIDDDQVFAALLKFIEQQKNLCVMPAKARKIFDIHGIDAVVEIESSAAESPAGQKYSRKSRHPHTTG